MPWGTFTGSGALLSGLTASRVTVTDGSKNLASASTTTTQVNYLSSATGTTGTASTNIVFSASPTLTGTITHPGGTITSSGITTGGNTTGDSNLGTISSVTFGKYYVGTFSLTFTGAFTANQAKTISYIKIGRMVTLQIPSVNAACSNATTITTTAALPTGLDPSADTAVIVGRVFDNSGGYVSSLALIRNTAAPIFYASTAQANFTAAGNCGWDRELAITYFSAN